MNKRTEEPAKLGQTIGDMLREAAIDRGAAALRAHQMAGRFTLHWEKLPNSQRRKWIEAARVVIEAGDVRHD